MQKESVMETNTLSYLNPSLAIVKGQIEKYETQKKEVEATPTDPAPESTAPTDPLINSSDLFTNDSQGEIDRLNAQPLKQAQADQDLRNQETPPPPPESNARELMEQRITEYRKGERNTGVAYFDNKKDLTLLDAYIAKQLGIDVKYLIHKVDMKVDLKHTREETGGLRRQGMDLASDFRKFAQFSNILINNAGRGNALGQYIYNKLGAWLPTGELAVNTAINTLTALQMKHNRGTPSNKGYDHARQSYYQAASEKDHIQNTLLLARQYRARMGDVYREQTRLGNTEGAHNTAQLARVMDEYIKALESNDLQAIATASAKIANANFYDVRPVLDSPRQRASGSEDEDTGYTSPTQRD